MQSGNNIDGSVKERILKHPKFKMFHELLTTEERYVRNLEILSNEVYPLIVKESESQKRSSYPSREEIDFIYSPLKPIVEFHSHFFYPELRKRNDEWDTKFSISDIFIKNFPFMKLYTTYVVTYPKLIEKITLITEKYPKFQNSLFTVAKNHEEFNFPMSFKAPLIRITKYKVIIDSYLKKMNEDDPELSQVIEARKLVNDVAGHCNKILSQKKSDDKIYEISSQFVTSNSIFSPGRTFVLEDEVKWSSESIKNMKSMKAFLFNDVIIIANKIKKKKLEFCMEYKMSELRSIQEIPVCGEENTILHIETKCKSCYLLPSDFIAHERWMNNLKSYEIMNFDTDSCPSLGSIDESSSLNTSAVSSTSQTPRKNSFSFFRRHSGKMAKNRIGNGFSSTSSRISDIQSP